MAAAVAGLEARSSRDVKGKQRAPRQQLEGDGGSDGVVVPLQLLQDSEYESVYTIPILVGSDPQQNLSLQVDTGSSDLWLASTSCGSSACQETGGDLYDPASATTSQQTFTIAYEEGAVSGPIVWDAVEVGGYTIAQQALAAASQVSDEPLDPSFVGVLGLALPPNSIIAERVPSTPGSTRTGAVFAANLLGLAGASAPAAPFLSLALERPGSSAVPSVLGVGRHPDGLVPDPSQIQYAPLTPDSAGTLFWKTTVRAITVYVNGQAHPVQLPRSVGGGTSPTAVLDSGVPVILATSQIANGIYGALGIGPASDGSYYVPCTTPLNMTITLDDRSELPLHPLDLTYPASSGSSCTGLIQAMPAASNSEASVTDIILGVPFLRNTYTVMAYAPPDASGSFANSHVTTSTAGSSPRLGLLSLTNATLALEQFQQVRVNDQPLSSSPTSDSSKASPGRRLSVGLDVLIGLLGLLVLCFVLFGARWAYARHRRKHAPHGAYGPAFEGAPKAQDVAYRLARRVSDTEADAATLVGGRGSRGARSDTGFDPTEDALRASRFEAYKRRVAGQRASDASDELGFGVRARKMEADDDETPPSAYAPLPLGSPPMESAFPARPPGVEGVGMPLLGQPRSEDVADLGMRGLAFDEFGMMEDGSRTSMAGVGTPRRGGRVRPDSSGSTSTAGSRARRPSSMRMLSQSTLGSRGSTLIDSMVLEEDVPPPPPPPLPPHAPLGEAGS
ncbi:hypothetical protein CERSUDRAFT_120264 [Gelatoporia subvermispora B]|uniref:Peptidase A1 domain-containing protein n=1 Tax=Ceriporiopsis subvermispora (strain B) TaxID=914234 RepID=M2QY78_CERS8|nr:hypothetical protein CERSUDRAFT_120264 [Gelatoporia subvermispora B]